MVDDDHGDAGVADVGVWRLVGVLGAGGVRGDGDGVADRAAVAAAVEGEGGLGEWHCFLGLGGDV